MPARYPKFEISEAGAATRRSAARDLSRERSGFDSTGQPFLPRPGLHLGLEFTPAVSGQPHGAAARVLGMRHRLDETFIF
jgi:hypothetical protein